MSNRPNPGRATRPEAWQEVPATNRFQAIVVGAGPAGAMAGRRLALLGRRVLLLERDPLPRYKPCGGGLTPKTVMRLPFPISEVPHLRVDRIDFRLRGESPVSWDLPDEFPFYMVMRTDLDNLLVQSATAAGVELRAGEPVRQLHQTGKGFVVRTDEARYVAPFIIGADGATGSVRRFLGIERRSEQGVALECELEVPEDLYNSYRHAALFDVEAAPEGYGWVFPKRSHLSVGLGSMRPNGLDLRARLKQFLLHYELATPATMASLPVYTHPLPLANPGERVRAGNALLVGDAAAVADGFAGEGICYAIVSGELAARAVSRALDGDVAALDRYEADLDGIIRRDHRYAHWMGLIVHRFPESSYHILTSIGEGKSVLIPLLLGQISFSESLRRLPRLVALDQPPKQRGPS